MAIKFLSDIDVTGSYNLQASDIPDISATYATVAWITNQNFLTTLPAHNHDDRYYTKSQADGKYLLIGGETDPVFVAHPAYGVTAQKITNWDSAFGWGDHSGAGYLLKPDADSYYQPIGNYDNYSSWNLKTNSVQRTTVTSGGTLNLVAGTNVTVAYSAGGTVTISSSVPSEYLTQTEGDARYLQSLPAHTHPIEEVDGLTDALDTKADVGHTHAYLPLAGGTLTGALVANAGITGLDINNGISGNNFNISGVNQLIINDPGEGIVFTGTNNVYLYAIDDATDNKINFGGASELQVNGSKVATESWVGSRGYLTAVPAGYATETYVTNAVSALVDSAPGTLDTLNELAAALGDDPNFATTITTAIGGKADAAHTHTIGDIDGLQGELDGKQPVGSYASSTHTHTFASLTSKPTTLSGYGITDAASSTHTHTFASLTSKPTTLSGYGITDAATATQGTQGATAYGWGNHASAGYMVTRNSTTYTTIPNDGWDYPLGVGVMSTSSSVGLPTGATYGYWFVLGRRDVAGGYAGIYVNSYQDAGTGVWIGRNDTGDSSPTWEKLWTETNFTQSEINNWGTAYSWGNHATAGYGSAGDTAKGVEAFGWGNHADAGYLTSVTNISGNAATATKLATARTISLSGDASGSATFDGSANATISVTVADDSHNHTTLSALGDYVWNNATNGRSFPRGIQTSFVSASQGYPSYGSVMRIATYSGLNDGGTAELYFPFNLDNGGDTIKYKLGRYNNDSWSEWYNIASREWVTAQNYLTSLPAHTHTFASLTSKPTTLSGYGITDAATSGQGTKADTAYGWGDHSQAGYITEVQGETLYQPIGDYASATHTHAYLPLAGGTLTGDLRFNQGSGYGRIAYVDNYHGMVLRGYPNNATGSITMGDVTSLIQYSGDFRFYRTNGSINELYFQVNSTAAYHRGNQIWDTSDFTSTNISNWNTAYGWGNHASAGYATPADITTAINNLVDSAPGALNTLNELAAAIGDDANFATTITNSIATKVSLSGEVSLSGMKKFETNASAQDDWQNSPISILERDAIGAGSTSNTYAPNLNFHWRSRIARSLWMASNGDLHYGEYTGTGVPSDNGTFHVGGGNSAQWNLAYGWGDHATAGYGSAGDTAKGVEAFGWGNHASAGYLTSEADTLATVMDRNSATSSVFYSTRNTASGLGNEGFSVGKTVIGNIHIQNGNGPSNNNSNQAAITFQGDNAGQSQAGIYVLNNNSYGTSMAFAVTESYGAGPQVFMKSSNGGVVTFTRQRPTVSGNGIWHAGDFSSTNISNWNTAYGWGNHAVAGYATQAWVTAQGFASATGNATQAWVTANYQPLGSYAASTHQHDASAIVSGQFAAELIPDLSGTYSLSSHSHTFASLTSKPTTLSGYGITDAASSSHTHSITDISDRTRLFNNMGSNHSTYQNFNDVSNFGPFFIQNTAGGPGTGSSQFYGLALGLGNDYAYGSYAMQMAIPRYEENDKYLTFRTREGGTWSGWVKFSAGYADSAGAVAWTNVSGRPTNVSSFTNDSGYITGYTETDTLATVIGRGNLFGTSNQGYVSANAGTYASELRKIRRITMSNGSSNWDNDYHCIISTDSAGNFADSLSINSYNDITLRIDTNSNNNASYVRFGQHGTSSATYYFVSGYDGAQYITTITGDVVPATDRTYNLGADDNRWRIVFCETLDSAGLHEANLASKKTGFYKTGTVLVWKNGEAVPCTEFADYMKIGIAVYGNPSPLVQGAEPVLCTGKVNEGDYLVTSQTEGHAIAMNRKEVKEQDVMDCVIGKALESGEGDSHLIKTWVNI